jgi:hypothetical protein
MEKERQKQLTILAAVIIFLVIIAGVLSSIPSSRAPSVTTPTAVITSTSTTTSLATTTIATWTTTAPFQVQLKVDKNPLVPGEVQTVTVHVTYNGAPITNAKVKFDMQWPAGQHQLYTTSTRNDGTAVFTQSIGVKGTFTVLVTVTADQKTAQVQTSFQSQ